MQQLVLLLMQVTAVSLSMGDLLTSACLPERNGEATPHDSLPLPDLRIRWRGGYGATEEEQDEVHDRVRGSQAAISGIKSMAVRGGLHRSVCVGK
eukprot:767144-Hanusia_phi.AAC.4